MSAVPKIITVKQPYAAYIYLNIKHFETGRPFTNFRGEIYIHSSAKVMSNTDRQAAIATFNSAGLSPEIKSDAMNLIKVYGAVICRTNIEDCLFISNNPDEKAPKNRDKIIVSELSFLEQSIGFWTIGKYAYKLGKSEALADPVFMPGSQGLWNCPANFIDDLESSLTPI